jgi:hypothetical protein
MREIFTAPNKQSPERGAGVGAVASAKIGRAFSLIHLQFAWTPKL